MESYLWNNDTRSMATNGKDRMGRCLVLAWLLALGLASPAFARQDAASGQAQASQAQSQASDAEAQKLPITTSSPAAARYFETGMVHYENHRWNFALNDWREAVKLDPRFALAYVWICFTTTDPAEESAARARAKALVDGVTP